MARPKQHYIPEFVWHSQLNMALKNLPSVPVERFNEVVNNHYKGDLEAAIIEFLKLHGK